MPLNRTFIPKPEVGYAAIRFLEQEPRRLRMEDWLIQVDPNDPLNPPCGTAVCFAGAICRDEIKPEVEIPIATRALELLGFTEISSKRNAAHTNLFFLDRWPTKFRVMFGSISRENPKRHVKALRARFAHFVKTGE